MSSKWGRRTSKLRHILSDLDISALSTEYVRTSLSTSLTLGPNSSYDWSFLFKFMYNTVKLRYSHMYSVAIETKIAQADMIFRTKNLF